MKRMAMLVLLAGCGDNLGSDVEAPGFESSFDGDEVVYFGDVASADPPAPFMPLSGATICVAGESVCTTSDGEGTFVLPAPAGDAETELVATASGRLAVHTATRPSATGDRNVGPMILIGPGTVADAAEVYDLDAPLDGAGVVLILAQPYGDDAISFEIEGATTAYIGEDILPDPERTSLSRVGVALVFGVAPGEAVLRTTSGRCDAAVDGWPGDEPNTMRLPITAGDVTIVHPLCGSAD